MGLPNDPGHDSERNLKRLAASVGLEFTTEIPEPERYLTERLPKELALKHHVIAVSRDSLGIRVHITDPLDFDALEELRFVFNEQVCPVISPGQAIDRAIDESYPN